jgi:hypothetical protein
MTLSFLAVKFFTFIFLFVLYFAYFLHASLLRAYELITKLVPGQFVLQIICLCLQRWLNSLQWSL